MPVRSRLIETHVPRNPQAAVLVLHGGASRQGDAPVRPTQLSVLRMIPIASCVARSDRRRLAVFRLLNSARGWNAFHTPVDDVHWALDQLMERFGSDLPTGLVGHSLGGRAALLAADRPDVRSVVGLNPWVYPDDGDHPARGTAILIAHGTDDRVARPESSAMVAKALAVHAQVGYVRVKGGKHAMLRRHSVFDALAADFMAATLLGKPAGGAVERVLQGESWFDV